MYTFCFTTCLTGHSPAQLGALGEIAEFSLRLSAANQQYGSDILLGPMAFLATREAVEVRPVEMFFNPVTKHLTEIYQLVDEKGFLSESDQDRLNAFWEGVILLRRNDQEQALEKFNEARDNRQIDSPLQYFIDKTKSQLDDPEVSNASAEELPAPPHARSSSEI